MEGASKDRGSDVNISGFSSLESLFVGNTTVFDLNFIIRLFLMTTVGEKDFGGIGFFERHSMSFIVSTFVHTCQTQTLERQSVVY